MKILIFAILAIPAILCCETKIPDEDQIADAWDAIERLIEKDERLGAKFLRLAFHDCVSPKCDGCINFDIEDNRGLEVPINALESAYMPNGEPSEISESMSRADFWALAGIVGVQWGIEEANNAYDAGIDPAPLDFVPGRQDCSSSPYTTEQNHFPSALMGSADTFAYFNTTLGLSEYETIALMGGHTLGKAVKPHVGFNGTWTGPTRSLFEFDGTYHHIMLVFDYGWHLQNAGTEENPKYQWACVDLAKPEDDDRDCGFMLNTDIGMLINLTVDSKGKPTCDFFTIFGQNTCGINWKHYQQIYQYDSSFTEDSENNFVKDFSASFTKVINRI